MALFPLPTAGMVIESLRERRKTDTRIDYVVHIKRDGNMWEALYGDDPMSGNVGYGVTPSEALRKLADDLEP